MYVFLVFSHAGTHNPCAHTFVCVCVQPTLIGPSRRLAHGTRRCARSAYLNNRIKCACLSCLSVSVCVFVSERECVCVRECGMCIRGGSVDSFLSQIGSQRAVRTQYTLSSPTLPIHDAPRCLSASGLSQQHARGTRRCASLTERSEAASFREL
jgi:hypothetical protein